MQNPWLTLPSRAPYILDEDRGAVERFNARANRRTRIETDLLPDPYLGKLDAPIVLLFLNPGVGGDEFDIHRHHVFRDRHQRCLRQEPMPYPNYYLDPEMSGGGARWHARILKPLIAEFGREQVAHDIAAIEFFPYHSIGFSHHRLRLPSQHFAFDMVRRAIHRRAVVFITRGRRIWMEAVPELASYELTAFSRSVQNPVISPRNCGVGYEWVRAVLLGQMPTP